MEQSYPRISEENLYDPRLDRILRYGLQARIDLVADLYLRGQVDASLEEIPFEVREEMLRETPFQKQAWLLDGGLAHRVAQAEAVWSQAQDDNAWRESQRVLSLWYQKGLLVLDLITEQDMVDFQQYYERDPSAQLRSDAGSDVARQVPSEEDIADGAYVRPHP